MTIDTLTLAKPTREKPEVWNIEPDEAPDLVSVKRNGDRPNTLMYPNGRFFDEEGVEWYVMNGTHIEDFPDGRKGIPEKYLKKDYVDKIIEEQRRDQTRVMPILNVETDQREGLPEQVHEAMITQELLAHPELSPVTGTETKDGSREFGFSQIIHSAHGHDYVIMYTPIEQDEVKTVAARWLYKSKSDGGWRVAYGAESEGEQKGRIIKGANEEVYHHYTQETKLVPEVLDTLENLPVFNDASGVLKKEIKRLFKDNNPGQQMVNTSEAEISYYKDESLDQKMSLARWKSAGSMNEHTLAAIREWSANVDSFSDYIEMVNRSLEKIPGFIPNFASQPVSTAEREHTLLGKITVEDFMAQYGHQKIVWSMARDTNGRVWVDNIRLADAQASSYGNYSTIFDAGLITSKPIDYGKQTNGLELGKESEWFSATEGGDQYVDITPVLGHLSPIKRYQEALSVKAGIKKPSIKARFLSRKAA